MQKLGWHITMMAELEEKAPHLPVPVLPQGFATSGWYVRPDILKENLSVDDALFQLRIAYNSDSKSMHKTIAIGGSGVDPARCKDKVYALAANAVATIRRALMIVP